MIFFLYIFSLLSILEKRARSLILTNLNSLNQWMEMLKQTDREADRQTDG